MNTPQPATPGTRAGLLARGSYILVVDDETAVLGMIETVLKDQGWTVKSAQNRDEALQHIESGSVPPVVLICDIMMTQMDGLALTRQLLAKVPRLKVIFMSARLAEISWWPDDLRSWPFLSKPFSNEELIAAVRDAISS